jgi:hypothetical protein
MSPKGNNRELDRSHAGLLNSVESEHLLEYDSERPAAKNLENGGVVARFSFSV